MFPPLPGQFGVTGPPFADPTSTVPGQTWDNVTATITGPGHDSPAQPLAVTGPDGNGTVTATIDTTGMAAGTLHGDDHRPRADPDHHHHH